MAERRPSQNSSSSSRAKKFSQTSRKLLLSMRNVRDPFGPEATKAIEMFADFVSNAPPQEINLEECSLFLSSSAKIFGSQVRATVKRMNEFTNFIANTYKEDQPEKEKKKTVDAASTEESVESGDVAGEPKPGTSNSNTGETVCDKPNGDNGDKGGVEAMDEDGHQLVEVLDNGVPDSVSVSAATVTNEEGQLASAELAKSTLNGDADATDATKDVENAAPISSRATKRSSAKSAEVVEGSRLHKNFAKRAKLLPLNYGPPPELQPIAESTEEELELMECDDDYPPILFPEVDLWNGTFDLEADPDRPDKPVRRVKIDKADILDHLVHLVIGTASGKTNSVSTPVPGTGTVAATTTDGVTSNAGDDSPHSPGSAEITENSTDTATALANIVTGVSRTASTESHVPDLAADDHQEIQKCINQLHYLPFTNELTTDELAKSFHNTVEHLECIFQKYSMPFNRQLMKAARETAANMVTSFSEQPKTQQSVSYVDEANSTREVFSQSMDSSENNIESLMNSNKTILERTKEKSVAESRAEIKRRLQVMQKMIVPKFMQYPLIAENTPEFFYRVRQFEMKMKKILADEEKKESFDVTKYEIEVLEATSKECGEASFMDSDSPDASLRSSRVNSLDCSAEMNGTLNIDGLLSPGRSDSEDRKWVSLRNVFHHMKKMDRNECARHFYAVLALLSSQNLDMNYDRHFSEEFAKKLAKKAKLDPSQVTKYSRGSKIMNARCPDADIEDIYLTALASKSVNENFRDLLSQEVKSQEQTDLSSPDTSQMSTHGPQNHEPFASTSDFVDTDCTSSFSGKLFGGKQH